VGFRGVWRTIVNKKGDIKTRKVPGGPMQNAMLTTNPLLPDEYYAPKGLDQFVIDMNKPVKHSLLDCPGRYTVKVATFSGNVIIEQKKINEIKNGKQVSGRLAEAADKAHRLTEALREQGHEAYEFHDRGQSIVCVGSFDSCGTPRADGKIEINPQAHKIMTTFQASQQPLPGQLGMPVKMIAGIPLDIQPTMVEVPKRSLSSDYADFRLGWGK
jgi:hypothetical protein